MLDISKAGVLTNLKRDPDFSKTEKIIEILKKNGVEPLLPDGWKRHPPDDLADNSFFEKVGFIITLGGDGTILSAAESAAMCNVPVMGINIGNLGYLTDCSLEEADKSIKRLIAGDFVCEKRIMLKAKINSTAARIDTGHCLNDVCVTRGETPKLIHFGLLINDNFVDNYIADGIIISTPTGSTAYNLSAGGPILIPNAEMIAITPICPHMLTTRPIVVTSSDKIKIIIRSAQKEAMITLDGQVPNLLDKGDIIEIECAENRIGIIKTNTLDFYDILRQKLIHSSCCVGEN